MTLTSLNPKAKQNHTTDMENLPVFPFRLVEGEITRGMSPKEISEVVSDKLIETIKKQFEATKIKLHSSK